MIPTSTMERTCFSVIKRSDNFWGVYSSEYNRSNNSYEYKLITSATTKRKAYQKLKLLNIGYKIGYYNGYN